MSYSVLLFISLQNPRYSLSWPHSMSPSEAPASMAPNTPMPVCWDHYLEIVLATAVFTMVLLLGYCFILRRSCGAFRGSTSSNRVENPNAGDPTEEIRNAGHQITTVRCLPIFRFRGSSSSDRVENPDANDPAEEIHSGGLELAILESLRISQFRKNNEGEQSEGSAACAVCLGELEEGQWLRHLPNCPHAFHLPCIDTWFQSHSYCPVCRSTVYDLTIHNEYSPCAVQDGAGPCQIVNLFAHNLEPIYESSIESAFDSPSGPAF